MKVLIATVTETLYDGEVYSLTAPAAGGEMTVLGEHMPVVTPLRAGTIRVRVTKDAEPKEFSVSMGVLEVTRDGATVLL